MAKTTKGPTPDPMQLWRDWMDQSERQWNAALNEIMSTDQFGQASGRMMDLFLAMQTSMKDATQQYFSALNVPTRTDVLSLAERLSGVEAQLAEISAKIDSLGAGARASATVPPRPKRTKKAPVKSGAEKAPGKKTPPRKNGSKKS